MFLAEIRRYEMKIDYKKIELFLIVLYDWNEPVMNTFIFSDQLGLNISICKSEFDEFYHYLKLLRDAELIECLNDNNGDLGFSFTGNGEPIISVKNFRLTYKGHQTYEAIKTNSIWKKIGEQAKMLGISGLKQIPTLAIKYFENNQ